MSYLESSVTTKKVYGSPSDVISDLPDGILENILTRMPLRDAVRTSVLSKRWRYSWTTLQQLVFDNTLSSQEPNKILIIVYQVLWRIKTLRKFSLSCTQLRSCPEVDNLIILLAGFQIKEFTLHILQGIPHKMPICFFSYQKLSHLELLNCILSPPETFGGFRNLVSLELVEVSIAEESFVRLISSCPCLENLKFQTYRDTTYGHIKIECPSLKVSSFIGTFGSVCFMNASRLATISLCSRSRASQLEPNNGYFFYLNLPALEHLALDSHYVKSFSAGLVRMLKGKLSFPALKHLKILELQGVCLGVEPERILTCILMCSLNLQYLMIKMSSSAADHFQGQKTWRPKSYLHRLRWVRVDLVTGTRIELDLLQFILAKSRVLEEMIITPHPVVVDRGFKILKSLSLCERLSPKVKIFI